MMRHAPWGLGDYGWNGENLVKEIAVDKISLCDDSR